MIEQAESGGLVIRGAGTHVDRAGKLRDIPPILDTLQNRRKLVPALQQAYNDFGAQAVYDLLQEKDLLHRGFRALFELHAEVGKYDMKHETGSGHGDSFFRFRGLGHERIHFQELQGLLNEYAILGKEMFDIETPEGITDFLSIKVPDSLAEIIAQIDPEYSPTTDSIVQIRERTHFRPFIISVETESGIVFAAQFPDPKDQEYENKDKLVISIGIKSKEKEESPEESGEKATQDKKAEDPEEVPEHLIELESELHDKKTVLSILGGICEVIEETQKNIPQVVKFLDLVESKKRGKVIGLSEKSKKDKPKYRGYGREQIWD